MSTDDPSSISPSELEQLMSVLGLHNAALARLVGVDRGAPGRWLGGEAPMPEWLGPHLRAVLALRSLCGKVATMQVAAAAPARLRDSPALIRGNVTGQDIAPDEQSGNNHQLEDATLGQTPMTPDEFKAALKELGWSQAAFARRVGCTAPTANRWAQGANPVPVWIGAHLSLMLEIQRLHAAFVQPGQVRSRSGP